MAFIPDAPQTAENDVPWFEDSSQLDIPGRGTRKSIKRLQGEIADMLDRLGAGGVRFTEGKLDTEPVRDAFQIDFFVVGKNGIAIPGRITRAVLPLRNRIPTQERKAKAQALYSLRDKLEVMVHDHVFEPNGFPLVGYLVGRDGQTVTEALMEHQSLPIGDDTPLLEGEVMESE